MTRGDETAAAHIPAQQAAPPAAEARTDPAAAAAADAGEGPAEAAAGERAAGLVLDDRAKEILAFERRWWRQAGSKEQAVRDTFGLSATRYYQLLNALLDDPAALAHDPVVVTRLRRLRASRTRSRGGRK